MLNELPRGSLMLVIKKAVDTSCWNIRSGRGPEELPRGYTGAQGCTGAEQVRAYTRAQKRHQLPILSSAYGYHPALLEFERFFEVV
jgi:hypothetical protein